MGFFSSLGNVLSGACSAICSCVSKICNGIAGVLGGTALGQAISTFVAQIGVNIPGINIIVAVITIASVVCTIAESLGIKEKNKDEPEELAMKAELDDKSTDDFESTEAYVKHLQEDIKLSKEDKERFENMSPEDKTAYRATGTYLYAKACSERLGLDTEGLKNPELVGLTVDVLTDLSKIQNVSNEFVTYNKYLQSNGLGMKKFSNYLHNRSTDLATDEKVQSALVNAMKELSPNISDNAINQKLYEMNIED